MPGKKWADAPRKDDNTRHALTIIGNCILILAAVSCTMGSVISAFWFTVDSLTLFLFWAVSAVVVSISASLWRAKGLLILLVPAAALFLLRLPEIGEGAKWLVHFISKEYNQWLFVPTFFPEAAATEAEQTLFFAFAGVLLSLLLSVSICLRRSTFLTILFTLPIVFLSFVIIFNQSDLVFLMGLLAVYLTLLFSSCLHPDSYLRRGLAVFPALAAALVLMGTAYLFSPPDNYTREGFVNTLDYYFRAFALRTGMIRIKPGVGWPMLYDDVWGFNTEHVAISEAGSRVIEGYGLLEIELTHPGTFYLRGYSMEHFNGNGWINNTDYPMSHDEFLALSMPSVITEVYSQLGPEYELELMGLSLERTGDMTQNIEYYPYYSFPNRWSLRPDDFIFYNVQSSIVELYKRIPPNELPDAGLGSYMGLDNYSEAVLSRETYLQIRGSTAEGLRRIAEDAGIDAGADREDIAEQVAAYFSAFGRYTLSPLTIPEDEDFALYFLQTSRNGYCIHYATAATLMLRALGVPARFTSGYVIQVSQSDVGSVVEVTDAHAHSWVEVFHNNYGWLPLEVTPPAQGFGFSDGRPQSNEAYTPQDLGPEDPDWMTQDPWGDLDGEDAEGDGTGLPAAHDPLDWRVVLLAAIIVAAVVVAFYLRFLIVRVIRNRRFSKPDTNAAVIYAWLYLCKLNRLTKWTQPPKTIEGIALKARFSQHTLTEQERERVVGYVKAVCIDIYESRGLFGRLWVRGILGL